MFVFFIQIKQYQELHDTKIALDMEINVFRQLLECEEDRLGLGSKSLNSSGEERKPEIRTSVERKSKFCSDHSISHRELNLVGGVFGMNGEHHLGEHGVPIE